MYSCAAIRRVVAVEALRYFSLKRRCEAVHAFVIFPR